MRIGGFAGLAALLALVVVAASVAIRVGGDSLAGLALVRGVHRAAASAAALLVVIVFWRALRERGPRRAASAALVLMLALSAVGVATGIRPPLAAALFNQMGGVALAALLAWIAGCTALGAADASERRLAIAALLFASLQIVYGGALVLLDLRTVPLFVAHAVLGLAGAATCAALGVRLAAAGDARPGTAILLCAALAPLAGVLSALPSPALPVLVGHAAAAALLLAVVAYAHGRAARSA